MLKLILWGVLLALIYQAVKTRFRGTAKSCECGDCHAPADQVDDVMVQDPVCGVYFPMNKAITLHRDGRAIHFCGTACRDRFLNNG